MSTERILYRPALNECSNEVWVRGKGLINESVCSRLLINPGASKSVAVGWCKLTNCPLFAQSTSIWHFFSLSLSYSLVEQMQLRFTLFFEAGWASHSYMLTILQPIYLLPSIYVNTLLDCMERVWGNTMNRGEEKYKVWQMWLQEANTTVPEVCRNRVSLKGTSNTGKAFISEWADGGPVRKTAEVDRQCGCLLKLPAVSRCFWQLPSATLTCLLTHSNPGVLSRPHAKGLINPLAFRQGMNSLCPLTPIVYSL